MDLNQLLYRHQMSLMRADSAECGAVRHAHRGFARAYADRILAECALRGAALFALAA